MKKPNVFRKPRAIALPIHGAELQERKLILKRLRPPPPWKQHWRWPLLLKHFKLLLNVFRNPELVRQLGPNERPELEHEWKEAHGSKTQYQIRL